MCVWTEDADVIRFGEKSLKIVYQNQIIKDYLKSNRRLGISGTKGQGKTFLLKVKRSCFQGKTEDENDNSYITCFPIDMMTDTLDSAITTPSLNNDTFIINKSLNAYLKDYKVWVQMWKLSVAVTIINSKEFSHLYNDKDFRYLNRISKNLLTIDNSKSRPCLVFSHLLNLNIKDFTTILQDTNYFIQLLDKINSAIYIFIDKVEQAFSTEIEKFSSKKDTIYQQNVSYWQYAQYSLADAAYQLFSSVNSHIKVFYTIRHEALLDSFHLAPNTCQNIESYLSELIYTQDDIFEMFKIYIENEDEENLCLPEEKLTNPEKAFFGLDTIKHVYVSDANEKIFAYLYRHSLRRPRDVMAICRALYLKNPKKLTLQIIRHTINDISNNVLKKYLQEVTPFITCNDEEIYRLLKCMNTNFFDFTYIQYVCQRYNIYHTKTDECYKNCMSCKNAHPFSTLYNIGLIGCLKNSFANPIYAQRFLPLGESKLKINEYDLPNSPLYCLHPCLCDVSRNSRNYLHHNFVTTNEVICGEGIQVSDEKISNITKSLLDRIVEMNKEKIFISSTIYDLSKERNAIKKSLFKEGYYPVLSESEEFTYAPNDVDSHDHCIDELLKCNTMIFIIGDKYGGKYVGEKYKSYIEEIKKESNKKITEPSISLMEFFAAKKNGLSYYVFVKKDVLEQQKLYNQEKSKSENKEFDFITCDLEVFKIINFVNHIKINGKRAGNWFIPFKSIADLKTRLSKLSFTNI